MFKKINKSSINLRFNVLTVLTYIIGIILIIQLFNLQIIHGAEYREESNTRLTRESILQAARGEILDRTGSALVTSNMDFSIELYKTKIDTDTLNNTILNIISVLDKYEIKYVDNFPIKIDPFEYKISDKELENWKSANEFSEDMSAEQAFYKFKSKYKIKNEDVNEVRKIISIRYAIFQNGYSSTKALKIADNIPREAVAELSENSEKFPGVNIVVNPVRTYNSGTLASHILGYAGKISSEEYKTRKDTYDQNDIIGKTGIEYVFEKYLKGQNGIKQIDMAVDGTTTGEYVAKEAVAGDDVVLTIDANLQKVAEQALAQNIQKIASGGFGKAYDTQAGSCVVMNVQTGEVLAMASYPDYNPELFVNGIKSQDWNNYINNKNYPLVNKTMQVSYAPGSIFKMITAIAGLESGVITINEKINDTGVYNKYNPSIPCWYYTDYHRGHGFINVSSAIAKSCNYFFCETSDRMGIDKLVEFAKYFGLGSKTGIELQSETSGVLASKESKAKLHKDDPNWNPGNTLNASIGQGDNEFTPLQMAKYISMLANGGKNIDVSIIKSIRKADGTEVSRDEINKFVNEELGIEEGVTQDINIKQENLNAVLEGMRSVTGESEGTAYVRFKNFNIEVGGKTGSAEAPNNKVHAWFVGFAPYDNPEIAVVMMVDNGGHGNYTAEAVRDIMAEYFGMNTQNVEEDITAMPYTEILR